MKDRSTLHPHILTTLTGVVLFGFVSLVCAADFHSAWPEDVSRIWAGPDFWANRLQDWSVANGRLECIQGREDKPIRTVHLITHRVSDRSGTVEMHVTTGLINNTENVTGRAAAGFLIGAGPNIDHRGAALIHHTPNEDGGIVALFEQSGRAVIKDFSVRSFSELASGKTASSVPDEIELVLTVIGSGQVSSLTFEAHNAATGAIVSSVTLSDVPTQRFRGNVALVSHPGEGDVTGRYWFRDWTVSGDRVDALEDCACGPIISTQYTLSRNVMKLTAQMMPVGRYERQTAVLQVRRSGIWETIASSTILPHSYIVPFRIEEWDSTRKTPYRVVYEMNEQDGSIKEYTWSGVVQNDPVDKPSIVVAGFTGNHNVAHPGVESGIPWTETGVWFPHNDIVAHTAAHNPDLLFFSGDNVYESDSPTRPILTGEPESYIDYMYKWYLWCWAYRDLTRNIPCVTIPDDHDVYQGNLWGGGGRHVDVDTKGGYLMPPDFVRMVEQTQMSHLPDPVDPRPIDQGIGVYFTSLLWGRIGFAVIEDRKFKSGCYGLLPDEMPRPDHATDPGIDTSKLDVPGLKLLGDRQLSFLRDWASDWRGSDMKATLSQTVFAGLATHHGANLTYLYADLDSNGWPQSGRQRALHEIRRGFGFMIGGDQHLATLCHHGIDDFNDAGWSFAVPSIANFYPREWRPPFDAHKKYPGLPDYCGEYINGLGNHVSVWAASNLKDVGIEPKKLHNSMPGYGIIRFNKPDQTITVECWPRFADPTESNSDRLQYEGWPKTIPMEDNYGKEAVAYLPTIKFTGITCPVVQIIDEADEEIVYTLRINDTSFRPKVFREGEYTIKAGEQGTNKWTTLLHVPSQPVSEKGEMLEINF